MQVPVRREGVIIKQAIVSPEDFEMVSKYPWSLIVIQLKDSENYYAQAKIDGRTTKMHRLIMGAGPDDSLVDHLDSDGLNNQRCNLRFATHSQNNNNRPKLAGTSSKFVGVSWDKRSCKWTGICRGKFLGYFAEETEAALAYDKEAIRQFGISAKTNGFLTDEEKLIELNKAPIVKVKRELPVGVTLTDSGRFKATLYANKKLLNLGVFDDKSEAELAVVAKRKEMEESKRKKHAELRICRNKHGQAILYAHDKNKNVTGEIIVDDEDWHTLAQTSWWINNYGYPYGNVKGKDVGIHQVLVPAAKTVNHINHNKLDNRRSNLHSATIENQNQSKPKRLTNKSTSKYIGVSKNGVSKNGLFRACISTGGKNVHLGHYADEEIAAAVYNMAAKLLHSNPHLNDVTERDIVLSETVQGNLRSLQG